MTLRLPPDQPGAAIQPRRHQMEYLVLAPPVAVVVRVTEDSASRGLIIPLIIQTIRLDRFGSVWTDEAPNLSSPDRSGADQIDAEHQATDLAVGGSNPSRRAIRVPPVSWRG